MWIRISRADGSETETTEDRAYVLRCVNALQGQDPEEARRKLEAFDGLVDAAHGVINADESCVS